jgi:hypothetical protein
MLRNGRSPNSIRIYEYTQHDATLHSLFISGNCCTCFGWYFTHQQERIQLYLQHLVFITPLLLSATIMENWFECAVGGVCPLVFMFILNYALQPFKVYCAIWVRRSNYYHQASPHLSPHQSTQWRKVELWARNVQQFCLNADWHVTFRDLLHDVKLWHGTDGFTSPPKEGVPRIFLP